jgi:hypothetical protein
MGNAYRSRWLLLLVGLGALCGCAQLTGVSAYAPGPTDPRFGAERYVSPDPDPTMLAQERSLAGAWAGMPDVGETALAGASTPAPAAVTRERPVTQTSAIQSEVQQPPNPSAGAAPATTPRRTLWDKQPWEVELDKIVRAICRGC